MYIYIYISNTSIYGIWIYRFVIRIINSSRKSWLQPKRITDQMRMHALVIPCLPFDFACPALQTSWEGYNSMCIVSLKGCNAT